MNTTNILGYQKLQIQNRNWNFVQVSSLVEDDRWRDEPRSYNPLAADENDWLYYLHIYTDNLPETKTVLQSFDDFIKTYDDWYGLSELDYHIEQSKFNCDNMCCKVDI